LRLLRRDVSGEIWCCGWSRRSLLAKLFCAFAVVAVVAASSAAVGFLAAKWMERRNGVSLAALK
jgi:hypothetical protein